MFPHSLSFLTSCPISLILSFIFFQSFQFKGKLGHLGLLRLETFGPWEDDVEQTRGQRQTGRNDLPGKGERVASGW